jgi:hypothetical protein
MWLPLSREMRFHARRQMEPAATNFIAECLLLEQC